MKPKTPLEEAAAELGEALFADRPLPLSIQEVDEDDNAATRTANYTTAN